MKHIIAKLKLINFYFKYINILQTRELSSYALSSMLWAKNINIFKMYKMFIILWFCRENIQRIQNKNRGIYFLLKLNIWGKIYFLYKIKNYLWISSNIFWVRTWITNFLTIKNIEIKIKTFVILSLSYLNKFFLIILPLPIFVNKNFTTKFDK